MNNYLHLYLGQECEITTIDDKVKMHIVNIKTLSFIDSTRSVTSVKLKLRPLSDMTDEEQEKWESLEPSSGMAKNEAARTAYLLSRGFDLFGLIEEGLAIPKYAQP